MQRDEIDPFKPEKFDGIDGTFQGTITNGLDRWLQIKLHPEWVEKFGGPPQAVEVDGVLFMPAGERSHDARN